jgi:tripartite-type tricarboxylate transporter receptor subunit TctC
MRVRLAIRSMVAVLLLATGAAHAQTEAPYPNRPIRLVVPYPAGGPVDTAARNLARGLADQLGQPVAVDNKPGASGMLGAAEVAKAAGNGYTVLFTLPDPLTYVTYLFKKVPYDPLKDFAPITQVATTPPALVLRNDAPIPTLKALGPTTTGVSFGTWGPGTYPHLIAAGLASSTRANLTIVGYRGGAPAVQDFMAGHIHMTIAGIPTALDIQQKGIGKIVAIASAQRSPILPDVPTFSELGFTEPVFSVPSWVGLAAPAGTPTAVVTRLRDATVAALRTPEMGKFFATFGWNPVGNTPADFRAAIERETPLVANAMRQAQVQPE